MKLKQIFNLNLARKFTAYFATLFVQIIISISLSLYMNKRFTINLVLHGMFFAEAMVFLYVPIFLLLVSSQIHMDNCLIILKYTYVEDWWKEKIKILLKDTLIYLLLIFIIPLIVIIKWSSKYSKVLSYKEFIFILEFLFIMLLLLVIYGAIYHIVLTIIKKPIAAYAISMLVPLIDLIFMYIIKIQKFWGITVGILAKFMISYDLSFKKHLFLSGIYFSYFLLFFVFLNIVMTSTLKKIDVYRGDKKSENR